MLSWFYQGIFVNTKFKKIFFHIFFLKLYIVNFTSRNMIHLQLILIYDVIIY